jgi:hypothetical protein
MSAQGGGCLMRITLAAAGSRLAFVVRLVPGIPSA